jgi:hypothetical protein
MSKQATLSRAIPALPGAAITSGDCGLRSSARTSACSRPPDPTTRTFFSARPLYSEAMKSSTGMAMRVS